MGSPEGRFQERFEIPATDHDLGQPNIRTAPPYLVRQASRLAPLERTLLDDLEMELETCVVPWRLEYTDYQSSGWHTASLINGSGRATDVVISDCKPQSTELLRALPCLEAFLLELDLDVFWARLGRLRPNSFLWEHVDYAELEEPNAIRLHIPIKTNPDARVIFAKAAISMTRGYIWKLDPREAHGAANVGYTPRVHVLLDCRPSSRLATLLAHEDLPARLVTQLPRPPRGLIQATLDRAKELALAGHTIPAEHSILRLFHQYDMPPGATLTLVHQLYRDLGDGRRRDEWARRRHLFLGMDQ
jgi:hypothetical protein